MIWCQYRYIDTEIRGVWYNNYHQKRGKVSMSKAYKKYDDDLKKTGYVFLGWYAK